MKRFVGAGTALVLGILATTVCGQADAAMPSMAVTPTAQARPVQHYYPAPGYYAPAPPPPGYYAPPPANYPPPQQYAPPQQSERDLNRAYDPDRDGPLGYPTQRGGAPVAYGYMCYAGVYVCQLPAAGPVGSGCSCPGWGAPSYGTIR